MTTAHRYPHTYALDEEGVTVHLDLCKPCAKALDADDVIDINHTMPCPDVDIEEGYTCDQCDQPIALTNTY